MLPKHGSFPNIKSIFESLEERVLFDGVPDATFVLPQTDAVEPVPAQVQNLQDADYQGQRELILIDAGVGNSEQLLSDILESKPDSALEIRMLDSGSDGVEQISAILAESKGEYDAIHIISHGQEGKVSLGNTSLSTDNLNRYADQLAGWSDSLSTNADILFYGCDLAGNAHGEQFIESISAITGADVAASDDLTGAADKGGDWELEETVGVVETETLIAASFSGVLADTDGDGVDDVDDLDADNDGVLNADEGLGASSGQFSHQNFREYRPDGIFGFSTANSLNGEFEVGVNATANADVPLEDGDLIVYSMNGGADLVAVTFLSSSADTEFNAEFKGEGSAPKIEFKGDGDYGGDEETLLIEVAFFLSLIHI